MTHIRGGLLVETQVPDQSGGGRLAGQGIDDDKEPDVHQLGNQTGKSAAKTASWPECVCEDSPQCKR